MNARSTNFSTSRVASSTVCPITLISDGTFAPSLCSETETPRARAALAGVSDSRNTIPAISSCATRIFMAPTSTSKWLPSNLRTTLALRPMDFNLTRSPSETCFTSCGSASGSPRSAPLTCATTVESNWSRKSRRNLATRRSASFESFWAATRSCTAFTASRA